MRLLTTILLSALFMLVASKELTYLAIFKANQTYIAENYCVNKGVKSCAGHCKLKQIIAKDLNEDRDSQVPIQMQEPVEWYYLPTELADWNFDLLLSKKLAFYDYQHNLSSLYRASLLRPPIV